MKLSTRLRATLCTLTGTTGPVVRRAGARAVLPEVFVPRWARLAGVPPARLAAQLDGARSFADREWCEYWTGIAEHHVAQADALLHDLAVASGVTPVSVAAMSRSGSAALPGPAAQFLAERESPPTTAEVERFVRSRAVGGALDERLLWATRAVGALRTAVGYHLIAAWPGRSPARRAAYARAQRLFRVLVEPLAAELGITLEVTDLVADGERVRLWAMFPIGKDCRATVLVTNGLDGSALELLLPLLPHRNSGLGFVVMDLPGTHTAQRPMSIESERVFTAVLDHLAAHPRVDADRIAMLGTSFGGYWAARMAAVESRLRCAVACGAPTHRGFGPAAAIGAPAIMVRTLCDVTGARGPLGLGRALSRLSLRKLYRRIAIPLLVVDGSADSVVDVRDSIELADATRFGVLRLYPGDDHCATGHFAQWLDMAVAWMRAELGES
ncbi:alpha/beta hydrolase family protein [Nocardia macrotermitis]|uniref:Esterase FrsA n=1 Tax=Nocardia macrotermitis TaxID=2585198 RepID=A0A7K0D5N0_9NOCA|nr:alpha/beta hydrolase [Nocardia macrotermitis]MQY20144.1 Esterase FrsA [Nocardia macrotermitis]